MNLIKYLESNFLTKEQLLNETKISEQELRQFQAKAVMPKCSYQLSLNCQCDSFFGQHNEQYEIEYYARGYTSWIGFLKSNSDPRSVFATFSQRYTETINKLKTKGFISNTEKLNSKLSIHIEEEWTHFLSGIYGLCTDSGLPEDIAAKELAISIINETIELSEDKIEKLALQKAVDLLDQASSLFAPHERLRSSRHRLIDEVRREYKLERPLSI